MDSTTSLVVKVSYGGVLRRFRVPVKANGQLDLDLSTLRGNISALLNFPLDADFSLTYSDEDGDVVALVDDSDLLDVENQRLKFLKIHVQSDASSVAPESGGSSTASAIMPSSLNPVLTAVPNPMRETVSKVYIDLASEAVSSSPVVGELFDCISKLGKLSGPQEGGLLSPLVIPRCPAPLPSRVVPSFGEKKDISRKRQPGKLSDPQESGLLSPFFIPRLSGPLPSREVPSFGEKKDISRKSQPGNLSDPQESDLLSPFFIPRCPLPSRELPSFGEKKDISRKSQPGKKSADLNEPIGFPVSKTSGPVPTSSGLGAGFNECPFSGSTVNNSGPNSVIFKKHGRRVSHSKKSSNGDYWTSLGVFHKGIRCDGCGVLPITGSRFKSKVKEDYDLCTICFSVMGNEGDYTRMDKPDSVQHSHPFRGQPTPFSNPWVGHVPQPQHGGLHSRCTRPKLDSRFVLDVNVLDGTVFAPSVQFTKIWKMRNNGSLVWPHGTRIVWIGGDRLSNSLSVDLQIPAEGVAIDSELDVKVDFAAPELPGRYISYWRMASSSGAKFGQRVWVLIHVDASLKGSVVNEFQGLNLNVSPDEEFSRELTGINVNHEPAQADSSSVNPGEEKGADLEGEAGGSKVLEKDDLPVGGVEPATITPSSSSSSFNMIEFPNMPAVEALGGGSSSTKDIPVDLQEDIEKNEVEITMLKELEGMGFKEIDLNKEILRENEYNLEQSVDALCGVGEWDPILEELQEMGFCDDATNKKLLKKNNGSIKGVVMDLLTGEKEA